MSTFLKQNWFKVGLLVVLTSFTVVYFVKSEPENQTANILDASESASPLKSISPSPTQILPTQRATIKPISTQSIIPQPSKTSTLALLERCLAVAKENKSTLTGRLLEWAKEENKDGKYNLSGAFESIDKQYEQNREECFNKYPQ